MINTITLNPAIDHILYLNTYTPNITNRLTGTRVTMGGKGTHVSMNLATMGERSRAYGFAYGNNGRRIVHMLEEQGILPRFVFDEGYGESRDNYLLVERDTRNATLVADKGPMPTAEHLEALHAMLRQDAGEGDYYVLSGDASNFTDPQIYNKFMEMPEFQNSRVFLDASGRTLLHAVTCSPFLIKPNLDEMSLLAGKRLQTLSEIIEAIRLIDRSYRIEAIVVSLGGDGSLARIDDKLYRVHAPSVEVYNTVGCGDCMIAGLLHGFSKGMETETMLRFATACASATAESPLSVGFDMDRAKALMEHVEIEAI